ncbi:hypothetical protein C8Q74DRAFT_591944 [Fomes fomentarius]|nr:hypothetical protein C8Q74DRAFT_591944 [Fomes fomentarius]
MDRDGSLHAVIVRYWMTNAAYYANILCWEGPIPPIVIRITTWLMTLNKRFGVDVRTMDGFDKLNALWRTYDDFMIWQSDKEKERLKKISKAPNQYRCAADGCGIQAINKRALRRCGGRCPDETKPHYCSLECQERHWFVHRHACTRGLSSLPIMDDDSDPAWIDVKKYETKYPNANLPDWLVWSEWNGAEIFIDFPHPGRYYKGDIIRVRSKTFGPEFLRSYRAMWQISQYSRKFNESLIGRPFDGSAPSAPHRGGVLCTKCGLFHLPK